ncbi:MAG: 1,2-phenylacetyl-CoA epoxidase subunit PaaD [Dehalococcoidia bacterium]
MVTPATTDAASAELERAIWEALREVADPGIPTLSVVDLGIIRAVRTEPGRAVIELMPTFLGCPAIGMIRQAIEVRIAELSPVAVELVRDEAWSSERISEAGRRVLRESGFAPPPRGDEFELTVLPVAESPYSGSRSTLLESAFGPTPCRAIHYCRSCRQPFEQFKAV